MAAGKPIICFAKTDDKFLEDLSCSVYIDPDSPEGLDTFLEQINNDRSLQIEMRNVETAVANIFNYSEIKNELLNALARSVNHLISIEHCCYNILCCENRNYLETVSAFDHPPARMIAARSQPVISKS